MRHIQTHVCVCNNINAYLVQWERFHVRRCARILEHRCMAGKQMTIPGGAH